MFYFFICSLQQLSFEISKGTADMSRSLARFGRSNDLLRNLKKSFSTVAAGRLAGKVALVTGAARGLGRATALEFIRQGARVIIADVDAQAASHFADDLAQPPIFYPCDVAVESQIADAVDFAITHLGKLDIMYNNAGITGPAIPPSIAELNLDDFDRVMQVNVRGVVAGIKHAARVMIPRRSGSILCTSSITGLMGGLGPHPYTISKFAIPGIVKSAASELCRSGVRINCISPAPIPTAMSVEGIKKVYGELTEEQAVGIINGMSVLEGAKCEEEDVARAALFLASDEAKYVSGHNLVVDGGFTCFKTLSFPSL